MCCISQSVLLCMSENFLNNDMLILFVSVFRLMFLSLSPMVTTTQHLKFSLTAMWLKCVWRFKTGKSPNSLGIVVWFSRQIMVGSTSSCSILQITEFCLIIFFPLQITRSKKRFSMRYKVSFCWHKVTKPIFIGVYKYHAV